MRVSAKGNIFFRAGTPQHPQCYALVVYDKDGKITRAYTEEYLVGQNSTFIRNLNIDYDENIRFIIPENVTKGQESPPYGVELNSKTGARKVVLTELREDEKFGYMAITRIKRKIQEFPTARLNNLKKLVERSRAELGNFVHPVEDDQGNIYEIVWNVPAQNYSKGATKIVWDSKTLPEGIKIIKWQKVK